MFLKFNLSVGSVFGLRNAGGFGGEVGGFSGSAAKSPTKKKKKVNLLEKHNQTLFCDNKS